MGFGFDILAHAFAGHGNRTINQIANDLFNIAADIPDFGKFRSFNLDEGSPCEFGETA